MARPYLTLAVIAFAILGPVAMSAAAPKKKGKSASLTPAPVRSTSKLTIAPGKPGAPKKCPVGMAPIPNGSGGFCIDRWEASLVEVLAKNKTKPHSPYETLVGKKVKAVTKKGVVPQAYISQIEAKEACELAGKRLCMPDEWLTACQGKKVTKYPYGDTEIPGRCNGDGTRKHPIVEVFGPSPDAFGDSSKMNDPRLNALPGGLAKTGSKAKCTNGFGVYDMVGNVHEWTADSGGQFKGGYYMDTHKNGDGCFYKTTAHNTSYHDYSTGFRCCK